MKKDIRTVTIDEAKKQLSKLIDQAAKGEPFIVARRGKSIPEDFDRMGGGSDIEQIFSA
jgi:hypothetical protein